MVDENVTFFITEHAHFDDNGKPRFCQHLLERIHPIVSRGFRRADVFVKLLPDGSLDFSDAMHMWWKNDRGSINRD